MRIYQWVTATLVALGQVATARAQVVVVPTNPVESGGSTTIFNEAGRTYLVYYHPSNFSSITTPVLITGMQVRIAAILNPNIPPTWPGTTLNYTNFDIQLSRASAAVNAAGQLNSNLVPFSTFQGSNVTTVRSGSLTIAPNSYINIGNPTPFGVLIPFSTPYLYSPGQELELYFTHSSRLSQGQLTPSFELAAFTANYASAIVSLSGYQAPVSDGITDPLIVQLTFAPVPEPSSLAMVGCAMAGVAVLRRRSAIR